MRSLDVRQAYIQAPWLGKPVYMYPPEGWENGQKVLAIDRAIYGLAESGLAWYKELKAFPDVGRRRLAHPVRRRPMLVQQRSQNIACLLLR